MSGQDITKSFQTQFFTGIFSVSLKNCAGCEQGLLPAVSFIVSALIRNAKILLKRFLSPNSS